MHIVRQYIVPVPIIYLLSTCVLIANVEERTECVVVCVCAPACLTCAAFQFYFPSCGQYDAYKRLKI